MMIVTSPPSSSWSLSYAEETSCSAFLTSFDSGKRVLGVNRGSGELSYDTLKGYHVVYEDTKSLASPGFVGEKIAILATDLDQLHVQTNNVIVGL